MVIQCALLCDAATAENGRLNILGGGLGRIALPELPGRLSMTVALRLVLSGPEVRPEVLLNIELARAGGAEALFRRTTRYTAPVAVGGNDAEEVSLSAAVSLDEAEVVEPGEYVVLVALGDTPVVRLHFNAEAAEQP